MNQASNVAELELEKPQIEKYRMALLSPAWTDTIEPLLIAQGGKLIDRLIALSASPKPEDAELRLSLGAQIATLRWLGAVMGQSVKWFDSQYLDALAQMATQTSGEPGDTMVDSEGRRTDRFTIADDPLLDGE